MSDGRGIVPRGKGCRLSACGPVVHYSVSGVTRGLNCGGTTEGDGVSRIMGHGLGWGWDDMMALLSFPSARRPWAASLSSLNSAGRGDGVVSLSGGTRPWSALQAHHSPIESGSKL